VLIWLSWHYARQMMKLFLILKVCHLISLFFQRNASYPFHFEIIGVYGFKLLQLVKYNLTLKIYF